MQKRRLTAIMFSDIVGYTFLMEKDEKAALQLLQKNISLHKLYIKKYHGELLKEIGDGILMCFNTSTEAVQCAGAIQEAVTKEGISLRIGIHEGEVVFDDGDVFGSGVNIASRIEADADPGQIHISHSVYQDIKNKAGINITFVGEKTFKNLHEPVRVYNAQVKQERFASDKTIASPGHSKNRSTLLIIAGILILAVLSYFGGIYFKKSPVDNEKQIEKSIAVLPFKNLSTNQENEYFCEGIRMAVHNHLCKIEDFHVISLESMEQFRTVPKSVIEIGKLVRANYLVGGSVQRSGNKVLIMVQLIHAHTDHTIWVDEYERNTMEIFEVQAEVTKMIASGLKTRILPETVQRLQTIPTSNLTAYEYYLKGAEFYKSYYLNRNTNLLNEAKFMFLKAQELDTTFAAAYAMEAAIYMTEYWYGRKISENIDTVLALCNQAILIDNTEEQAFRYRAAYYSIVKNRMDLAVSDLEKAFQLNPNYAYAILSLGRMKSRLGDPILGLTLLKKHEKINPIESEVTVYRFKGEIYLNIGHLEKAKKFFLKSIEISRNSQNLTAVLNNFLIEREYNNAVKYLQEEIENNIPYGSLTWFLLLNKEFEEIVTILEQSNFIPGSVSFPFAEYGIALAKTGRAEEGNKVLTVHQNDLERRFDSGENHPRLFINLARLASYFEKPEKVIDYLRMLPSNSWPDYYSYLINDDPFFENMLEYPEFLQIVQNVNEENANIRKQITRLEIAGKL